MNASIPSSFIRYFAASLIALGVDATCFSLSYRLFGFPWFWAAPIGFVFGAATAYGLSIKWVFAARSFQNEPAIEFAIFVVVGVAGLAITELILLIFIDRFGQQAEIAKLFAAVGTFIFNYATRKAILFSNGIFGFFQRNEVVR